MDYLLIKKQFKFELDINPIYAYDLFMYLSNPLINTKKYHFKGNKKKGLIQISHGKFGKTCRVRK